MLKFSIFGFRVTVTFGFLFTACILLLTSSCAAGIYAAAACVIHELGHCFAAILMNVRFIGVKFWAGGISIQPENRILSYGAEITELFCGPLFNTLFCALFILTGTPNAAAVNASLALFNLFPYSALDGGCIIKLLFEQHEKNGAAIQKITAVFFSIFILILYLSGSVDISLCAVAILLTADEFIPS